MDALTAKEIRAQAAALNIPLEGARAFLNQRTGARRRGIAFELSLFDWWRWWQVDGRWLSRGSGRTGLVMARNSDDGPYDLTNVYVATNAQNVRDAGPKRRGGTMRTSVDGQTRYVGAVDTPLGRFQSVAIAASKAGISKHTALSWIRTGQNGWAFAESDHDDSAAPKPAIAILGINLRQARLRCGMSQAALATVSGVTECNISQYERGTGNPRWNTMCAISAAVGLTLAQLLTERPTDTGGA